MALKNTLNLPEEDIQTLQKMLAFGNYDDMIEYAYYLGVRRRAYKVTKYD